MIGSGCGPFADRLLGEAHASGGDPLQLTQLFGISDPTAIRYCAEPTWASGALLTS